jgi:hypothetical protein
MPKWLAVISNCNPDLNLWLAVISGCNPDLKLWLAITSDSNPFFTMGKTRRQKTVVPLTG